MNLNIVAGETYWVCYDCVNAYQVTPQSIYYNFLDDQAWTCETPRGRGNIWSSKMHLTKKEAIDENIKRYVSR